VRGIFLKKEYIYRKKGLKEHRGYQDENDKKGAYLFNKN